MTQLAMLPDPATDEATAFQMIREARVALALLERFSADMTHTWEGRVHLRLIRDACCGSVEWATLHCLADTPPSASAPTVEPSANTAPGATPRAVHSRVSGSGPAASTNDARPIYREKSMACIVGYCADCLLPSICSCECHQKGRDR